MRWHPVVLLWYSPRLNASSPTGCHRVDAVSLSPPRLLHRPAVVPVFSPAACRSKAPSAPRRPRAGDDATLPRKSLRQRPARQRLPCRDAKRRQQAPRIALRYSAPGLVVCANCPSVETSPPLLTFPGRSLRQPQTTDPAHFTNHCTPMAARSTKHPCHDLTLHTPLYRGVTLFVCAPLTLRGPSHMHHSSTLQSEGIPQDAHHPGGASTLRVFTIRGACQLVGLSPASIPASISA